MRTPPRTAWPCNADSSLIASAATHVLRAAHADDAAPAALARAHVAQGRLGALVRSIDARGFRVGSRLRASTGDGRKRCREEECHCKDSVHFVLPFCLVAIVARASGEPLRSKSS